MHCNGNRLNPHPEPTGTSERGTEQQLEEDQQPESVRRRHSTVDTSAATDARTRAAVRCVSQRGLRAGRKDSWPRATTTTGETKGWVSDELMKLWWYFSEATRVVWHNILLGFLCWRPWKRESKGEKYQRSELCGMLSFLQLACIILCTYKSSRQRKQSNPTSSLGFLFIRRFSSPWHELTNQPCNFTWLASWTRTVYGREICFLEVIRKIIIN